jgi:regulator of RNase E activity RraA
MRFFVKNGMGKVIVMPSKGNKTTLSDKIKQLCERLEKLDSAAVSDVFDAMGLPNQVLATHIRPIVPNIKVAGPTFCIRGVTSAGSVVLPPAGKSNPAFEIDRAIYHGCVAVIETGRHEEGAIIGGNVALSYKLRGCRGAVVDGGVRDIQELTDIDFRTFAASTTPMSSKGRWSFVDYEVPIAMPGHYANWVRVNPGDLILADPVGIAVIPQDISEYVVSAAEEIVRVEQLRKEELQAGADREEVYARHDTRAHIKSLGL